MTSPELLALLKALQDSQTAERQDRREEIAALKNEIRSLHDRLAVLTQRVLLAAGGVAVLVYLVGGLGSNVLTAGLHAMFGAP